MKTKLTRIAISTAVAAIVALGVAGVATQAAHDDAIIAFDRGYLSPYRLVR